MMRALILGLLAICAVSSCKRDSDSGQVAAGAPAGRVVEASGKVAATREGKTRTLAVGADVFRDDVVETGSDGSLVIELAHNNARWAVESAQRTRVDESVAWGLAKQDKPAKVVDHATSAAGRDGERTAAETGATSGSAATEAAPAAAAPVAPQVDRGEDHDGEAGTAKAPPRAKGAPPRVEQSRDDGIAGGGGAPGNTAPRADPAPPPPPPPPANAAPADTVTAAKAEPTRGGRVKSPQSIVDRARPQLLACGKSSSMTVHVALANGKPTVTLTGLGSQRMADCIKGVIKKLEFPAIDGEAEINLAQ